MIYCIISVPAGNGQAGNAPDSEPQRQQFESEQAQLLLLQNDKLNYQTLEKILNFHAGMSSNVNFFVKWEKEVHFMAKDFFKNLTQEKIKWIMPLKPGI